MKDEICRVGGVLNIRINQYLIQSAKNSHGRNLGDLEAKRNATREAKGKSKRQ